MALPESSPVAIAIFFSSLDFVVDSTVEDSLVCVLCSEEEDSSTDPSTLSEEAVMLRLLDQLDDLAKSYSPDNDNRQSNQS